MDYLDLHASWPAPDPLGDADLLVVLGEPDGVGGVGQDVEQLVSFLVNQDVFTWAASVGAGLTARTFGDAAKEGRAHLGLPVSDDTCVV